jgi:hypothetical protein
MGDEQESAAVRSPMPVAHRWPVCGGGLALLRTPGWMLGLESQKRRSFVAQSM